MHNPFLDNKQTKQVVWNRLFADAEENGNSNAACAIFYSVLDWHYCIPTNTFNPIDVFCNKNNQKLVSMYPIGLEFVVKNYYAEKIKNAKQGQRLTLQVWISYLDLLMWGVTDRVTSVTRQDKLNEVLRIVDQAIACLKALSEYIETQHPQLNNILSREIQLWMVIRKMGELARNARSDAYHDQVLFLTNDVNLTSFPEEIKVVFQYLLNKRGIRLSGAVCANGILTFNQDSLCIALDNWPYVKRIVFETILFLRIC
ncbi:MAG: hypothetical protein KA314_01945 [Chloroflexi bacterium]|nr:hypothetical protein [Chloroflexota bacterium]MBP8054571.1 hypothetical protein [Chloroflexota bacterium]